MAKKQASEPAPVVPNEKLTNYISLASDLISANAERNKMFAKMDNIWHIRWTLPEDIKEQLPWVSPVRSTDGHDTLRAVSRVLSKHMPKYTVWPTSDSAEAIQDADELERSLRWFMHGAFRTGQGSPLAELILDGARYGEICGQMLFTPYQKKMLKGFGAGAMPNADDEDIARRTKVMESGGPLQVRLRKPADVHTLYGDYGVEAVCHATIWEPRKLLTSFGKLPGIDGLRDKITAGAAAPFYAVYDMSDFARHIIWAEPTEDKYYLPDISSGELSEGGLLFMNEKNDLPFINWVCRISGSTTDEDVEDQRIPMLYTVDKADQFNIQNIVQTLVLSEAIRTAAAPRGFRSGPGADKMDVDYGDPAQDIVGKTGQTYTRLPPPELDRALFELSNWITTNVEKSTVPRVLQGGNVPSQTFSTLNLTVQSGMQVVEPYKQLSERWLEDASRLALKWVAYDGKVLSAIVPDDGVSEGGKVAKRVKTFVLDPSKFDADALIIAAELEPDLPVDRTARINGARMLQEMGMPARVSWEELGEKDATGLQREARFEQLERFFFERFMNQIKMNDELAMQQKSQAMQMEMQMAAQQAMQPQPPPPPQPTAAPPAEPPPWAAEGVGPTGQEPVPGTPPGMEGIEGQGWNPAQGGTPPSQANPEATFEGQTGTSRGGQEIV